MKETFLKIISCPVAVLSMVSAIAALALISAFSAEAFFGLEPCPLCIYQRWPFAIVILLGLLGLAGRKYKPVMGSLAVAGSAIAMLANSGIAFYHTGVEQKWWLSAVEGCAVPNFGDTPQSILENILSAPTARCDEIAWQDPILGLSMANYNIVLCLGLAVFCGLHLLVRLKKSQEC